MAFMDRIKEMVGEGLSNAGPQIGQELSRLFIQGKAELGSGLFSNSNSYVPYGQGQNLGLDPKESEGPSLGEKEQPEQERGGREM